MYFLIKEYYFTRLHDCRTITDFSEFTDIAVFTNLSFLVSSLNLRIPFRPRQGPPPPGYHPWQFPLPLWHSYRAQIYSLVTVIISCLHCMALLPPQNTKQQVFLKVRKVTKGIETYNLYEIPSWFSWCQLKKILSPLLSRGESLEKSIKYTY